MKKGDPMISRDILHLKQVTSGDIEDIEGYYDAIESEDFYELHHKLETPSMFGLSVDELGLNNDYNTQKSLKDRGLYFHRPIEELIFLESHYHRQLHSKARGKNKISRNIPSKYKRHAMWMRLLDGKVLSYSDWKALGIRLSTDRLHGNNLCECDGRLFKFLGSNCYKNKNIKNFIKKV